MTERMANSLNDALDKWNIHVPNDIYDKLKANQKWIRETTRVKAIADRIDLNALYEIFDFDHHFSSAIELFNSFDRKEIPVAVVYGQKEQGKSQFLFFLFKLLQEVDEIVIYLDSTILPDPESLMGDARISQFWNSSSLSDECKDALSSFQLKPTTDNFRVFIRNLRSFATKGNRVWVIVDEVVEFSKEKFPIAFPKDQAESPLHWVLTGSTGITSWVSTRHLENFTFDLPLFSRDAIMAFATKLCNRLGFKLVDQVGDTLSEGLSEWLEERFGGIIGYVTELCLALHKQGDVRSYLLKLDNQINYLLIQAAKAVNCSPHDLSRDWLNAMKGAYNEWRLQQETGICGHGPPRGVVFTTMLRWLFRYYPDEDSLFVVRKFRNKFCQDPGLDGCLLELEVILELQRGLQFEAAYMTLVDGMWISRTSEKVTLPEGPPEGQRCSRYSYEGEKMDAISLENTTWTLVELTSGFDVVDVVLPVVDNSFESPTFYGIQITRAKDPFQKHRTIETCSTESKQKLEKLWNVIRFSLNIVNEPKIIFTLIAPNCESDKFKPRAGHVEPYYFSPAVFNYRPSNKRFLTSQPTSTIEKCQRHEA